MISNPFGHKVLKRNRLISVVLITAASMLATACTPTSGDFGRVDIYVSKSTDRSKAEKLNGQTVKGSVAIFAGPVSLTKDGDKAEFKLDGKPFSVDNDFPFDINGTTANAKGCTTCADSPAALLDTKTLSEGKHTLEVIGYNKLARSRTYAAEFTVDNFEPATSLRFSKHEDRTGASGLDNAIINGTVYMFVGDPEETKQVDFYIDNPTMKGSPSFQDKSAPWDYEVKDGKKTTRAIDTETLKDGTHSLAAQVTTKKGDKRKYVASFIVSNKTVTDSQPPTGSVVVAEGNPFTGTRDVKLSLAASDNVGVTQMRVTEGDINAATWAPFEATRTFTLSNGDGTKTVSAQFRDQAGNASVVATSSIALDSTAPVIISSSGDLTRERNTPIDVSAAVIDVGAGVAGVSVKWAKGASTEFETLPMVANGNTYSATLPAAKLDVRYYFTTSDVLSHVATSPAGAPGDSFDVTINKPPADVSAPTGTIVIDGDAPATRSQNVTLKFVAQDNVAVTEMRVSNGMDASTASWQPYVSSLPWTLPGGDGQKDVAVQYRDAAANVSTTSIDRIALDTTGPAIADFTKDPTVNSTDTLTLSASVTDANAGVGTVTLFHAPEGGGAFTAVAMQRGAGSMWSVALPQVTDGTRYYFEATDVLGNVSAEPIARPATTYRISVVVTPPVLTPPPTDLSVATSVGSSSAFLYTGSNAVQTGVAPNTIASKHAAVLRGRVLDRAGNPLSGAVVTITNHPEYGQTVSRLDGFYDLVVNGGESVRVHAAKDEYLPVERTAQPVWEDYEIVDDIVLVQVDAKANKIVLADVPAGDMAVAQASTVTDADGERTSTLLVPPAVQATMVMPNGERVPVAAPTFRSTEYTVGDTGVEAMPGTLPPQSAYTYAMELSIDEALSSGAETVEFSTPLVHYNDNFLGFPAGTTVPAGYYDTDKGAWVASDNGVVVKIIDIRNGVAELDVTGDGNADGANVLESHGITNVELAKLAALYEEGESFWRTPIPHFSPWDLNWAWGLPFGAESPLLDWANAIRKAIAPSCGGAGSVIGCQDQSLGEEIELAGVPMSLNYTSMRTPGYNANRSIALQVSGATIPSSVRRIEVEMTVAGKKITEVLPVQANQLYTYDWDGLDAYGRRMQGEHNVQIRVGYVYDASYRETRRFGNSGGNVLLTGDAARQEVTLWSETEATVSATSGNDARGAGLGGWTFDAHHTYDPQSNTVTEGDGTRRKATFVSALLQTVAGTGQQGVAGDGAAASAATLDSPGGIAVDNDGNIYVSTTFADRVRKIAPDGTISTIAGNGNFDDHGNGGLAVNAALASPTELSVDLWGNLYIADVDNHMVRKVSPDGIITTIAGSGVAGNTGDGGPATQATLVQPAGIAVDGFGNVFIADFGAHVVRMISADGTISTVAGTGQAGFNGDGPNAVQQQLNKPAALAVTKDGDVYVADSGNNRIRRITPSSAISTIAGTGVEGQLGDGGPATQAQLSDPVGIAFGRDGNLLISDRVNDQIREIGSNGVIRTVAGSTRYGVTQDGQPAMRSLLANPRAIAVGPDDTAYIAESDTHRVRKLTAPGPSNQLNAVVVPSADGSMAYEFDGSGHHLRTMDSITGVEIARFTYDAAWRVASVIDSDNRATTVERDANGTPVAITGPDGIRNVLVIDANGWLTKVTGPAGDAVVLAYHGNEGLLSKVTSATNESSSYQYDSDGYLTHATGRDGKTTTLVRQLITDGFRVTKTTPEGRAQVYETKQQADGSLLRTSLDAKGLLETEKRNVDGTMSYDVAGANVSTVMEPDPRWGLSVPVFAQTNISLPGKTPVAGKISVKVDLVNPANPMSVRTYEIASVVGDRTWKTVYDAASRTFTSTLPTGRASSQTLDAKGRVVSERVGDFAPVNYVHDALGRVTSASQGTGADERKTTITYDVAGNVKTVKDALNRTTTYDYDQAGNLTSVTASDGAITKAGYDDNGNVTSITPAGKGEHALTWGPQGNVEDYAAPGVNTREMQLTDDLEVKTFKQADGTQVSFNYDNAGRVTAQVSSAGTTSYNYEASGRLASMKSTSNVTTTLGYDGMLPTTATYSGAVTGSVGYTYDNLARVTGTTVNGSAVTYGYDNDDLLNRVGSLNITRNAVNGMVTSSSLGRVSTNTGYNAFGDTNSLRAFINGTKVFDQGLAFDNLGRITTSTETVSGAAANLAYAYDDAGRLKSVSRDGTVIESYVYDQNGNRTSVTNAGGTTNATYDSGDRLLSSGNETFTYNANGETHTRTSSAGATTYSYTNGQLSQAQLSGKTVRYTFDANGKRVAKFVDNVETERYLWDGNNLVAITTPAGAITHRFVYGTSGHAPDYLIKNNVTYRIVADVRGSIRQVIDTSTGAIVQALDYDAWGNVVADTNPGFQPLGYASGLHDKDTGLIRFGVRDYDPKLARFLTPDTIGFAAGTNHYIYADADPINRIDPSGHLSTDCMHEILGGLSMAPGPG